MVSEILTNQTDTLPRRELERGKQNLQAKMALQALSRPASKQASKGSHHQELLRRFQGRPLASG